MELLNNLSEYGLTTKILQIIIVGGLAVVLVGLYWRLIAIGAGIFAILFVFLSPTQATSMASTPAGVVSADVAPAEFIEDCLKYSEHATKESCQKDWKEAGNGKE